MRPTKLRLVVATARSPSARTPMWPPRHGPQVGVLKAQPASMSACMVPSAAASRHTCCVPGRMMARTSGCTLRPRRIAAAGRRSSRRPLVQPPITTWSMVTSARSAAAAADLADVTIDQVVIGGCTNGRLEDLRPAAAILRGRKVHPNVRAIVLPGTQQVCLDAAADGTMQALIEAGCAFSTPTCGPCLGGHMGVLAEARPAGRRAEGAAGLDERLH